MGSSVPSRVGCIIFVGGARREGFSKGGSNGTDQVVARLGQSYFRGHVPGAISEAIWVLSDVCDWDGVFY